jgi:NADH:ubiquinone oxidoreductase subunit 3 (chain A)
MGPTARPTSLTTARTHPSRAAARVRPRSAELERTRKESGFSDALDVPADRDLVRARFGFSVFSVIIATITGPKRYNKAKLDFYECGIEPAPMSSGPNRFPVKYFLTAMLFIVFDIEIIFLYPYAVENQQLSLFGLVEIFLFIVTVFVAYAYVWRRGGLDWD